jgi:hypothetical protein
MPPWRRGRDAVLTPIVMVVGGGLAAPDPAETAIQRYLAHLPAAGELVLFDRSWYTRAGVERVMGFCSPAEYQRFMDQVPRVEAMRHVLDRFAYDDKDHDTVGTPDPRIVGSPADVYDEDRLGDHPGRHPEHGD